MSGTPHERGVERNAVPNGEGGTAAPGRRASSCEEVHRIRLFHGLPPAHLDKVAHCLHAKVFAAGTPVLTTEQKGSVVYFIREGTIKICSEGWDGHEIIIAIVGAGEALGEINTVDGLGHSANAVTLDRCSLFWMDREAFDSCRRSMPELNDNLLRLLARRARFTTERLHVLATRSMSGRLASQLLSFADACGIPVANGDIVIPLRLTQNELAALIGASRQHTNGILRSFTGRGLILTNEDHYIVLRDRLALGKCG